MTYEQLNRLPVWSQMPTITLDEMSAIKLMNRVDTKYVMRESQLDEMLRMATAEYSVQVIGEVRACRYSFLCAHYCPFLTLECDLASYRFCRSNRKELCYREVSLCENFQHSCANQACGTYYSYFHIF
jgi:hypothetical protein